MSANDEGKSKTFYWLRVMMIIARAKARSLRKAAHDAEQEYRLRLQRLQGVCPHVGITGCDRDFYDGGPNGDVVVPAMRRCGDCGLLENERDADRKLFARAPDRIVTSEEFSKIIRDAMP